MDTELAQALNRWSDGSAGAVWVWMGTPGAGSVLPILTLALLGLGYARGWPGRSGQQVVVAIAAAALAVLISDPLVSRGLKPWLAEPRPCAVGVTRAPPELGCGAGFGMPSAHAANTAAVASAVGGPALTAVAAVVGVSRVVDGQHWPADVVVGWIIGAVTGHGARALVEAAAAWLRARRR